VRHDGSAKLLISIPDSPQHHIKLPRHPANVGGKLCRCAAPLLLVAALLAATPVLADCTYSGQSYPEGTRIGVLVCENGKWVVRP
jgi:hypothetical protein